MTQGNKVTIKFTEKEIKKIKHLLEMKKVLMGLDWIENLLEKKTNDTA